VVTHSHVSIRPFSRALLPPTIRFLIDWVTASEAKPDASTAALPENRRSYFAPKRVYEIFEEALSRHLGFTRAVENIWTGISPKDAPTEQEAAQIAAEELAVARAERRGKAG
jgi:hypothetical protein